MGRKRKPNLIEITVKEKHGPHLLNKLRLSSDMLVDESFETFRDQVIAIIYRKTQTPNTDGNTDTNTGNTEG
jgi:hypothetical protein